MLHAPASDLRGENAGARGHAPASPQPVAEIDMAPPISGNQALLRMRADGAAAMSPRPSRWPILQRKCACGGTCAGCSEERGLRRKPAISEPGDALEQEADRVAERVMRMPAPALRDGAAGKSAAAGAAGAALPAGVPSIVGDVLQSPGRPLDPATRAFMEPRFQHDFGEVRVHTDARAAQSARAVNALAYTVNRNVVFDAGRYAPSTADGRRLLAHELTHTMQQSGTASAPAGLQRKIGDGHDLTAPRFAGDAVLEAVYDDERVLKAGDSGPAVKKLQQALLDSGMALPKFGADGKFGPETKAAVSDFQHASGLTGGDLDGIVGPITMSWLDQRFSAGPTPAGAKAGSTPGCAAIKTVDVDLVELDGSTQHSVTQLERANTILSQCCVRFNLVGGGSEGPAATTAMLGGDTDLLQSPSCGSVTAEETALFDGVTADFALSSRLRGFFVATINSGAPSYSVPPFCATGPAAAVKNMAVVANSGTPRALAHEFSHILLDSGVHPADPLNLMAPVAAPPGEQLTAAQCATIFANA